MNQKFLVKFIDGSSAYYTEGQLKDLINLSMDNLHSQTYVESIKIVTVQAPQEIHEQFN